MNIVTKFNKGEVVYFIYNHKYLENANRISSDASEIFIFKGKIIRINILIEENKYSVDYVLQIKNNKQQVVSEKFLAKSIDDLLNVINNLEVIKY